MSSRRLSRGASEGGAHIEVLAQEPLEDVLAARRIDPIEGIVPDEAVPVPALGIAGLGHHLVRLREAPEDTLLYEKNNPVPLSDGTVYVVSTNRISTGASSCVYYAKLQPVTIDVPAGTLKFRYVASPVCNGRDLVSPD